MKRYIDDVKREAICTRCQEIKSFHDFWHVKSGKKRFAMGYLTIPHGWCKACTNKESATIHYKNRSPKPFEDYKYLQMKKGAFDRYISYELREARCFRCEKIKSFDDFYHYDYQGNGKIRPSSKCKPCQAEYNREWQQKKQQEMKDAKSEIQG